MKIRPVGTDCFMPAVEQTDMTKVTVICSEFGLKTAGANAMNSDTTQKMRGGGFLEWVPSANKC